MKRRQVDSNECRRETSSKASLRVVVVGVMAAMGVLTAQPRRWINALSASRVLTVVAIISAASILASRNGEDAEAAVVGSYRVSGRVTCPQGQTVTSITIQSASFGTGSATFSVGAVAPWQAMYNYRPPYGASIWGADEPDRIRIRVGCGKHSKNWTPWQTLRSDRDISVLCDYGTGTATRCRWMSRSVLIGMPFTGKWGSTAEASTHPAAPHPHHSYSGDGSHSRASDVSVDLYAPAGTKVRARAWAATNKRLELRYSGASGPTCVGGGFTVIAEVYLNDQLMGWVAWAHLANVPDFEIGQNLRNKVIGETKRWGWSTCYQVTNPLGVHVHFEADNLNPDHACYWIRKFGSQQRDGTVIAMVGQTSGTTTGIGQQCTGAKNQLVY